MITYYMLNNIEKSKVKLFWLHKLYFDYFS